MSMTPERWAEVQRLFGRARELPAAMREAFVHAEAGPDSEIAAEVLRLLRAEPEPSFLAPPEPGSAPAPRRLGDFELLEELGRGRFGVVYRARQLSLGRIVAVKVLMPSVTLTPRDVERFSREPRAVARLHHPNIVQVLTVGEDSGARYFAMDLIQGPTLAEEVKRLQAEHGVQEGSGAHLPSSRAGTYFRAVAELARQAADGLSYAHQHGIVHRDVKPSNLILDTEGHVLIVDFGLARDEEQGTITKSDVFAGTPHYMSPEQASGYFHRVDERTDVYSLGVVLYELLTLRRPFEGGTTYEVLRNIREHEAPRIRGLNPRVPRDLEVICNKAMARDRNGRYASAADLRDDLQRFLAHEAILARPPGLLEVLASRARRHRVALAVTTVAVSAALGGILLQNAHERRAARRASLDVIRAALATDRLGDLPLSTQIDLRRRLRELEADEGVPAADLATITALERGFVVLREELEGHGISDLGLARDPRLSDGVREQRRLAAMQTLLQAAHLFPEDDELRRLASSESAFPTISVSALDETGQETSALVHLREVEVLTSAVGEKQLLGPTPLAPTPVRPGYYRIVVTFEAGGSRELICNPGPAEMEIHLTAQRRTDEDQIRRGMVEFPAASYTFPAFRCEQPYSERTVALDAFLLDSTEVSNREYHEFLRSTEHALPRPWLAEADLEAFLTAHGELPVVAITWRDAVAFAEWRGKRLPTAAEWHRAAGGLEGRAFPYSSDPDAPLRGNVLAPQAPDYPGFEDAWNMYLESAAPVTSHPEARTPEGIYHMFGNVYEYTESMVATRSDPDGLFLVRPYDRWLYGGAWDARILDEGMRTPYYQGTGPSAYHYFIGFRCAVSADP